MISLQTEQANIFALQGKKVESIVGIFGTNARLAGEPIFFWMKMADGTGHRFFLDFAILHWKEFRKVDESELVYDPTVEHRELVDEAVEIDKVLFRQIGDHAVLVLGFRNGHSLRLIQNRYDDRCRLEEAS